MNVATEWRPNSTASVEVSERNQRAMTYTLAVVDEGLLDLTSFKTPNLHAEFYRREALGVSTWDLFDEVAGAYSADLERLLALGGSDSGPVKNPDERRTRFPPVVRYLGPFELKAGERKRHDVEVPQYIGAVRVMVVAGQRGAYGSAEKSVFVRQPLMLLPTLPRVLGPEEEIAVPVSVFVSDPAVKQATVQIEADGAFEIVGEPTVTLNFSRPEEQLASLRLRSKTRLGKGLVKFTATGGKHRAAAEIYLDVRSPNPATTNRVQRMLEPGESWALDLAPHGLPGTNVVSLEVSAAPPLNLERRLHYLISYPYGCLEQTTSAIFPQLYLSSLLKLEDARKREIQRNVQDGVHRLSGFQAPNGAFLYWPGGFFAPDLQLRNTWSTSYAGHFLVEAKKLGYSVPDSMIGGWVRFQRATAQSWSSQGESESLDQAYRLYTLALAGQPEIGAMNRLRERMQLPASARWMLAAAYKLAGLTDAAVELAKNTPMKAADYAGREQIFGSELRDNAIALTSLVTLGRAGDAQALADEVSRRLSSEEWHSTQSTAYALMSMAHYVGLGEFANYTFERTIDGKTESTTVASPLYSTQLPNFPDRGAAVKIVNTANRRLFVSFTTRGVPASGADVAGAQGLFLKVEHRDEEGRPIDIARLPQGADLIAEIAVSNETGHRIDNIALAQLAAGRLGDSQRATGGARADGRARERRHAATVVVGRRSDGDARRACRYSRRSHLSALQPEARRAHHVRHALQRGVPRPLLPAGRRRRSDVRRLPLRAKQRAVGRGRGAECAVAAGLKRMNGRNKAQKAQKDAGVQRSLALRLRSVFCAFCAFLRPFLSRSLLVGIAVVAVAIAYWRALPRPLFAAPLATIMLDRHGELLGGRIADDGQWRFPPRERVPEKYARALIEYEDQRFYSHHGVDPLALARAILVDVRERRIVSGGSTLTMQVARLARARSERGVTDKLLEMLLATRLELAFDKESILAHARRARAVRRQRRRTRSGVLALLRPQPRAGVVGRSVHARRPPQ